MKKISAKTVGIFIFGFIFGIITTFILAVAAQGYALRQAQSRLKPPKIGLQQAEFSWTLRSLQGETTTLEAFRGRPLFLHLWDADCFHCLAEVPILNRLYDTLQQEDIAFISVVVRPLDNLQNRLEENQVLFPVYLPEGGIPETYQGMGLPQTFIIGADGTMLVRHVGGAQWDNPDVLAYLRMLRTMSPPNPSPAS